MSKSGTTILVLLLVLLASLALSAMPAFAARSFPETGYSVTNDKFLDYYDHRGGARALGLPISREFDLLGTRVQFFQRAVLQLQPDGSVALMNVLDEGLLPYTKINGSTFPAPDPALIQAAPSPASSDYASMALDFVRAFAPNTFEGMPVNFFNSFSNTVTAQDAFPNGGDASLLPLINLEIWGLPTSKPTRDPANGNFVYLRFQRGIMHFDASNGTTQGILIGDYLKSVITGQNLPADLDQQAKNSRLYRQYNNSMPNGLARAEVLPGSNLFSAFEKDGVVVPTPNPIPVATTVPATATPVPTAPAALPTPAAITVTGTPWFVDQINAALSLLATKQPYYYQIVRQNVFRIEATTDSKSSSDIPNRTLKVREADAFPGSWRFSAENQQEWDAAWIVHSATHIEQYLAGRPNTGDAAEREARERQVNVLNMIETTNPTQQFSNLLGDVLRGTETSFDEWAAPYDPLPTPVPTATPIGG